MPWFPTVEARSDPTLRFLGRLSEGLLEHRQGFLGPLAIVRLEGVQVPVAIAAGHSEAFGAKVHHAVESPMVRVGFPTFRLGEAILAGYG